MQDMAELTGDLSNFVTSGGMYFERHSSHREGMLTPQVRLVVLIL